MIIYSQEKGLEANPEWYMDLALKTEVDLTLKTEVDLNLDKKEEKKKVLVQNE